MINTDKLFMVNPLTTVRQGYKTLNQLQHFKRHEQAAALGLAFREFCEVHRLDPRTLLEVARRVERDLEKLGPHRVAELRAMRDTILNTGS